MVSTARETEVVLLQPGSHAETPNRHGEQESFILLVEDDRPTLRLEQVILEEAGHEVRVVESGEEALQSLAEETPALVLLDIGLPGMDGFTTCERIRESSHVPVLMVSGLGSEDDKERGRSVGATDYVTKPFDTDELAGLVNKLLREPRICAIPGDVPDPSKQVPEPVWHDAPSVHTSEGLSYTNALVAEQPESAPVPSEELVHEGSESEPETEIESLADTSTVTTQNIAAEPEPAPDTPGETVGQDSHLKPNEGLYEGTVRLTVTTQGAVSGLLSFVGLLRQNPGFRLLRLVANQSREGMDIWLGLRGPLSLGTILLEIEGVSQVTPRPADPDATESEPVLIVHLGVV